MRTDSPYRRPDGREQRSLATRRRIYDAALEEFRRVGFDAASIARITVRAGVSRPSFYFHFPTKVHVLLEFQWELEHEVVERLAPVKEPDAALHGFVDELVRIEERTGRGLFGDLLQAWARPPERALAEGRFLPVIGEVGRRFRDAERAGLLRAKIPAERVALLFLTGVFGYLLGAGRGGDEERADLHALVDLYVAAPAGASRG